MENLNTVYIEDELLIVNLAELKELILKETNVTIDVNEINKDYIILNLSTNSYDGNIELYYFNKLETLLNKIFPNETYINISTKLYQVHITTNYQIDLRN